MAQLITDAERQACVLVVDDDLSNLGVVTLILQRAGFANVHGIAQADQVLPAVRELKPDVVLLDLHMPGADGIEMISDIIALAGRRNYLPILVLTGDSSVGARDAALSAGAKDFLTKPYERMEVILRTRNLVETRLLHVELQRQNEILAARFAQRTEELEAAKVEILERLARASDFRDESTHAHTERVGELSARIARRMNLPAQQVEHLGIAARLHDIGKIGLSDLILLKPGPLGPAEFVEQERHTLIGANILAGSRFPILRLGEEIALTHHEAWDGSGYPRRLRGEEIPLSGRIVAVADVFDALTHARPYKQPWSAHDAVSEIVRQSGCKFDANVVSAFLDVVEDYLIETNALEDKPLRDSEVNADGHLLRTSSETDRARVVRDILRSSILG